MTDFCTKFELYNYIESMRLSLEIADCHYPLKTKRVSDCFGIKVASVAFQTPGLRGMAIKGRVPLKDDVILLNSFRREVDQNFDCGHEIIHLLRHRRQGAQTFQCFEKAKVSQVGFMEWQANEGAAELIVPYKKFIPLFVEGVSDCYDYFDYDMLLHELAQIYNVPKTVITFRIESLKYEISQYESNINIDDIDVKSRTYQRNNAIVVPSYNDKFDYIS